MRMIDASDLPPEMLSRIVEQAAVDERRQHTARTHPDWTPAHSLNDGMRIASKRLLRDLWRAARDHHEEDR